jgi:hypothetical protein
MDVGRGSVSKRAEEILHQFGLEITDVFGRNFEFANAERATGKIERGGGKAIVHGHQEISSAQNSTPGTKRSSYRFAERDANIFNGVMLVNVKIAARRKLQVESAVARDLFQHVIEETNAR